MKYSLIFALLLFSFNLQADDYTAGCGPRIDSHASDFFNRTATQKDASIAGLNCQFIVDTSPQSGQWLPSAPSLSFTALDNSFFNTYEEQSGKTEFSLHWPIYRSNSYETGFNYGYQRARILYTLASQNTNWLNNQVAHKQQSFNTDYFSTSAYVFFPKNKLMNEVGFGVNRYKKTGEVHKPNTNSDYLADIDAYEWFIYIEHKDQELGWDLPFRFALHKGQYWNTQKKSQALDAQLAGMDISLSIRYSHRINYRWTLKADITQAAQVRFVNIDDDSYYYKSWFSAQRSGGVSIYYHF